jgi:spore maturation protein CgeB
MPAKLRIAYLAHSLRSDWNNGNAHFLRGLMRALVQAGQSVTIIEPESEWSIKNLQSEPRGADSLRDFASMYPELNVQTYSPHETDQQWEQRLAGFHIVILHEWNPAALAERLLHLRAHCGYKLLFHDTHHRASSSPEQIERFGLDRFNGILAFGEALRRIYVERFALHPVWTLHEAADITVFHPLESIKKNLDIVWIGNWGEGERAHEITKFLLRPAAALHTRTTMVYGVRYPPEGLDALRNAGVSYGGYLPNLDAPAVYAAARMTLHIPRQQYTSAMTGIPTIRVFEALACGIPLVSAPWQDTERLFRPGDFCMVDNADEMEHAMHQLLTDSALHTCAHRAHELISICERLMA